MVLLRVQEQGGTAECTWAACQFPHFLAPPGPSPPQAPPGPSSWSHPYTPPHPPHTFQELESDAKHVALKATQASQACTQVEAELLLAREQIQQLHAKRQEEQVGWVRVQGGAEWQLGKGSGFRRSRWVSPSAVYLPETAAC